MPGAFSVARMERSEIRGDPGTVTSSARDGREMNAIGFTRLASHFPNKRKVMELTFAVGRFLRTTY